MRRQYSIPALEINGNLYFKLVIDPHVDKHSDHINDELIQILVKELKRLKQLPFKRIDKYEYYVTYINFNDSIYRLVWLIDFEDLSIGIITVFKDRSYEWASRQIKK